jgi:hypothetical protein
MLFNIFLMISMRCGHADVTTFSQSYLNGIPCFRITLTWPGPSKVTQLDPLCNAATT